MSSLLDIDIDIASLSTPQLATDNFSFAVPPPRPSPSSSAGPSSRASSLKRAASPEPDEEPTARKRMREEDSLSNGAATVADKSPLSMDSDGQTKAAIDGDALADDLNQELECGCCAGLVYKPVIVNPCEHFFCGSCCTLWIRNGGTNCPKCRGVSTSITPSRPLQIIADILARADPSRARSECERTQADEIYPDWRCLKFPTPREPSPEPSIPTSTDFIRPCPHCSPGNSFGYSCHTPLADPDNDIHSAWPIGNGNPPGHAFCGNCENVLSLQAPQTSKCDFCQVAFCGINVQQRCVALPLMAQHPHNLSDVSDLIQSAEIYDAFDGNTVEVEFMLDHMNAQRYTPRHVYRDIIQHYSAQADGFAPMFHVELFADIHSVEPSAIDPDVTASRRKICRLCASEVMLFGLRDWWIRERRKGFLEGPMVNREDCPDGRECGKQNDLGHAKEFNHVIMPPEPAPTQGEMTVGPMPPFASSSSLPGSIAGSRSSSPIGRTAYGGHGATHLPSLRDLGIPMHSTFVLPPIMGRPTDVMRAALAQSSGSSSSTISRRVSSAPEVPDMLSESESGFNDDDADKQAWLRRRVGHYTEDDLISEPTSSERAVEAQLAAVMLAGYGSEASDSDRNTHQVPYQQLQQHHGRQMAPFERDMSMDAELAADMSGYPMNFGAGMTRSNMYMDAAMDAAMERRVDAELDAQYALAIRQALMRTEEADADLRNIRSQIRMQDAGSMGMDSRPNFGTNGQMSMPVSGMLASGSASRVPISQPSVGYAT